MNSDKQKEYKGLEKQLEQIREELVSMESRIVVLERLVTSLEGRLDALMDEPPRQKRAIKDAYYKDRVMEALHIIWKEGYFIPEVLSDNGIKYTLSANTSFGDRFALEISSIVINDVIMAGLRKLQIEEGWEEDMKVLLGRALDHGYTIGNARPTITVAQNLLSRMTDRINMSKYFRRVHRTWQVKVLDN